MTEPTPTLPPDDPTRELLIANLEDPDLEHIGLVGDTYTVLVRGSQTNGAYTLIDMLIPPGGGPGPHRHDFEELFVLLEGSIDYHFRDEVRTAHAGDVVNIPANAPHFFRNTSDQTVHVLCLCTPAGQEDLFHEVGEQLESRHSTATTLEGEALASWARSMAAIAPRYRSEILEP